MKKIFFITLLLFGCVFFAKSVTAMGTCGCTLGEGIPPMPPLPMENQSACNTKIVELIAAGNNDAECIFTPSPTKNPENDGTTSVPASGATAGTGGSTAPAPVKLTNPLTTTDIRVLLGKIITVGMGILGSVTLLVFVFGGFTWLTSAGSAEKVKKGTQTMVWAVVGLFLIFGSYGIMGLVLESIDAKEQGNDISSNLGTSDPTAPSPTTENPVVGDVCGDGTIGPGETCDDINTDNSDGCSAECQIES
ncbi:MAG: hypothetical protein ABIJ23_04145 [Candidatus Magasanikbacteria bacterium]